MHGFSLQFSDHEPEISSIQRLPLFKGPKVLPCINFNLGSIHSLGPDVVALEVVRGCKIVQAKLYEQ